MTPDVQSTNERMVYRVRSETSGKVYRVDLLANNGAGGCSCTDFGTRRQPNLDAGMDPLTKDTTCKHQRKAIRLFNLSLFRDMAKADDQS